MMARDDNRRAAARKALWSSRELLLPHLLEHRDCGVYDAVATMCEDAGWTFESYLLAALFDRDDLLTEATK